jgi:hypothetical protein
MRPVVGDIPGAGPEHVHVQVYVYVAEGAQGKKSTYLFPSRCPSFGRLHLPSSSHSGS